MGVRRPRDRGKGVKGWTRDGDCYMSRETGGGVFGVGRLSESGSVALSTLYPHCSG